MVATIWQLSYYIGYGRAYIITFVYGLFSDDKNKMYMTLTLVAASVTMFGNLMVGLFCKERIELPKKEKVKISKALFPLFKYKNYLAYHCMQWVNAFAWLGRRDMAHRIKSLEIMGGELCNGMFYNSYIVGGVNFVGIDDSFYQTEYKQLEFLKKEADKGYPIVLFMHAPLYEKELYKKSYKFWNGEICLLGSDTAAHPEVSGDIAEPTASAKAFYEYVAGELQIKAILSGHLHFSFESRLPGGTMQYIINRSDKGNTKEIKII